MRGCLVLRDKAMGVSVLQQGRDDAKEIVNRVSEVMPLPQQEATQAVVMPKDTQREQTAFMLSVFGVLISAALFAPLVDKWAYILVYLVLLEASYYAASVMIGFAYRPWQRALVATAALVGFFIGKSLVYLSQQANRFSYEDHPWVTPLPQDGK